MMMQPRAPDPETEELSGVTVIMSNESQSPGANVLAEFGAADREASRVEHPVVQSLIVGQI
jgi:hypothetical protein